MIISTLDITITQHGPQVKLHVQGPTYGVETDVTLQDVRRLAGYLER